MKEMENYNKNSFTCFHDIKHISSDLGLSHKHAILDWVIEFFSLSFFFSAKCLSTNFVFFQLLSSLSFGPIEAQTLVFFLSSIKKWSCDNVVRRGRRQMWSTFGDSISAKNVIWNCLEEINQINQVEYDRGRKKETVM